MIEGPMAPTEMARPSIVFTDVLDLPVDGVIVKKRSDGCNVLFLTGGPYTVNGIRYVEDDGVTPIPLADLSEMGRLEMVLDSRDSAVTLVKKAVGVPEGERFDNITGDVSLLPGHRKACTFCPVPGDNSWWIWETQ